MSAIDPELTSGGFLELPRAILFNHFNGCTLRAKFFKLFLIYLEFFY